MSAKAVEGAAVTAVALAAGGGAGPSEGPLSAPPVVGGGGGGSLATREADIRTSIRPTVARIDLGALARNFGRFQEAVGSGPEIYAVVKADAYGHGAVPVARTLAPVVHTLAVSLVEEGLELREAGLRGPILVLGAYYGSYHDDVLAEGLTPVVYDPADIDLFAEAAAFRGTRAAIHLKVDTGMSRLGVSVDELPAVLDRIRALPSLALAGLCTHLASADAASENDTRAQLRAFSACRAVARARGFVGLAVHAANSAASVRFPEARLDAVRPGLALYGAMPSPVVARPELEPVLELSTRIMALRDVAPGAGVSYGGLWRAPRPSRIATLPLGYADGYPRHAYGAEVLIRGRRAPVVGAVCMDMLMVDATDVPGVALDDVATIIGRDGIEAISVDDMAAWAGTVNYEILCGISKRVPRIYTGTPVEGSEP